jgi:mannosyltransferase
MGLLGVLVCSIGLTGPALWADELATWGAARLSFGQLVRLVQHVDVVLAPYYVFMDLWVRVAGTSEVALRVPSVLAAGATVALTVRLGTHLGGRRVGVTAGLLLLLVPAVDRFGQEARPYAFGTLGVVLAAWLLVSGDRWRHDLGGAVALLFASLMQPMTLLSVPGLALARPTGRRLALLAAACLPATGMLLVGLTHQSAAWSWIHRMTWEEVPGQLAAISGASVGLAVLVLAALGIRRETLVPAVWAFGGIALLLLPGLVEPLYVPRMLLFTTPALAILGAVALSRVGRAGAVAGLVVLGVAALPPLVQVRQPDGHNSQNTRLVRDIRAQPGDVVVYETNNPSIPWSPRDAVAYYLAPDQRPRDVLMTRPPRTDGHFLAGECTDLPRCLGTPARVWLVRASTPRDPLAGLDHGKGTYLRKHYRIASLEQESRMTVALLVLR